MENKKQLLTDDPTLVEVVIHIDINLTEV